MSPLHLSLRAKRGNLEEQNPESEIPSRGKCKTTEQKRNNQHAELEVFLHFALYFCFLLLHFGVGILVLVF